MAKKDSKIKKPKKNSYYRVSHAHEPKSRFLKRVSIYGFFMLLTVVLTTLIFYRAKGYTFTTDGKVEKRGIVLIDSTPVSAKISIDGKDTGKKTDYKLEVSEGSHTLKLEAEGYKTWEKQFSIKSEEVEWFYYPYLIPSELGSKNIQENIPAKVYSDLNSDNKVLAASKQGSGASQSLNLELLDLKQDDPSKITSPLLVPTQLFSRQADGTLGEVSFSSWSPNGDSIYLEYNYSGKKELINIRVDNPGESSNLTTTVGTDIAQFRYDDRSRLYLLRSGELAIYNPETLAKETIIDTSVLNFNNFKEDKYVYAKASTDPGIKGTNVFVKAGNAAPRKVALITVGGAGDLDYQYTVNRRTKYLSISNSANKELAIYKNPLETQEDLEPLFLSTFKTLKSNQIKESVSGSAQPGSYIALQLSDSSIFIYKFEDESSLTYDLAGIQAQDISWIDSEHLQARTVSGEVYYFDYDGNYQNKITTTNQRFSYFIKVKNKTVTVNASADSKETITQVNFKK